MNSAASLPSRFIDPSRGRKRLSLGQRWYYGGDPTPEPGQSVLLADGLSRGDPLADALVEHWFEHGVKEGRVMLDVALARGVEAVADAPEPLRALFAQLERVPLWLDRRCAEHGRRAGVRVGAAGSYVLSSVALMGGYRFASVTKPLVMTGALEQRTVRRLDETSKFVRDVYSTGGLERFGVGYASAVRVRMMHALVRRSLTRSPRWRMEEWGLPINQTDMLGTNVLFSVVYLTGLRAMGMRFSRDESEGLVHMWRYIGYLLGVDEALLPANELEGRRMAYAVMNSQPGADEDSRKLAAALRMAPATAARTPLQKRFAPYDIAYRTGLSRAILGDRIADELGLPADGWKYAIAVTTPLTFALETVRMHTPGLTALAVRLGERALDKLEARVSAQAEVTFMPERAA